MDEAARAPFRGFSSPYYTQVPDILFDELLAELSGAELKVLLYIIRRTFGFKKDRDNISLSQMVGGITARDGTVLDRGTGLNKDTVIKAIRSLEERHMIRKIRRSSEMQGDEATTYELVMEEEGGVGKSDTGGCRKIRQGGVGKSDTQYTVLQYTDLESSNNSKDEIMENRGAERGDATLVKQSHSQSLYALQGPSEQLYEVAGVKTTPEVAEQSESFHAAFHGPQKSFSAIGDVLNKRRPAAQTNDVRTTITTFITDMATEFHDQAPIQSSVSRACNLFSQANLSMEVFLGRLFEARSITKERKREGRIRSGHSSMGYFFSVLGERLGLKQEGPGGITV